MAESLQALIERYLFERTADGVLLINTSGMISRINPAAIAMLGITPQDAREQKPARLFRYNPGLVHLITRQDEQVQEVFLPRRRVALGMGMPLPEGMRLVMLQDVTEQRRVDSNREELIQRMAHDLRNPLMAMGGFAELVESMGELSPQQKHFVMRLRQTATKLYDVSAALVDLAWVEAGMPLQHRPVRLQTVVMRAIQEARSLAEDRRVTIAFSVQDPLPRVMGDPDRLTMVIVQILQNAILYSEPDTSIAIHAWSDGWDMYCSVADKGIGISEHEVHLIFDRLYRSSDTRVQATPGGGLGLTLVKKIVLRHGGDVWVNSTLGEGSTFTMVLPAIGL